MGQTKRRAPSANERGLQQMQSDFELETLASGMDSPMMGTFSDPMEAAKSIIEKETGKRIPTWQVPDLLMDLLRGPNVRAIPMFGRVFHRAPEPTDPVEQWADTLAHEAAHFEQGPTSMKELALDYFEQPREQGAFLAEQRRMETRRRKKGEKPYQWTLPPRLK